MRSKEEFEGAGVGLDEMAVEILLVEDNPNDVELTLRALKKQNLANNVHVVRDGEEALEYIFATGAYADRDVNNRPKMIPVVILTSSREERDLVESYKLGVNSYLVKPVDFDKFVQSVSELGLYWLLLNKPPY